VTIRETEQNPATLSPEDIEEGDDNPTPGHAKPKPGQPTPKPAHGVQEKPDEARTMKLTETAKPRRELRPYETKVDWAGNRKKALIVARKVSRVIRRSFGSSVQAAAQSAAKLPIRHLDEVSLPTRDDLVNALKPILNQGQQHGYDSVYRERAIATKRTRKTTAKRVKLTALEPKHSLTFISEATVTRMNNWLSSRAGNLAASLLGRGLDAEAIEREIVDELLEGGGFLDRLGLDAALNAMASGRSEAMQELQPEIAKYIRSEVDDDKTCETCDSHDGDELDGPDDWQPGDDCDGGDACRGQVVCIFDDEGQLIAE
jgi:hypothetical protein